MAEIKKSNEPRDYKERFEFVLTTGGNIICQRYFRINNFNPISLRSYELTNAIRECAAEIDRDLMDKTRTYLSMYAPMTFNSVDEMNEYFFAEGNEDNAKKMHLGEGIVVRGNDKTDYVWGNAKENRPYGTIRELGFKFDDGEITSNDVETNKSTYKFTFKVDGREVCSYAWDGYYPKFVRDKIDLANKRGKFSEEDVDKLSFEQYLLYKMVQNKSDMVYGLIKNICNACSLADGKEYTTNKDDIMDGWNADSNKAEWRIL